MAMTYSGIVRRVICLAVLFFAAVARAEDTAGAWRAGIASIAITPEQSMWMAGYAARDKPSEGKVQDLYAKALALEDARGTRLVFVTMDLIGIPRPLRDWLENGVAEHYQLPPEGLLLNASHTHCGPELRASKASLYGLEPERIKQSQAYLEQLREQLLKLVGEVLANLAPRGSVPRMAEPDLP